MIFANTVSLSARLYLKLLGKKIEERKKRYCREVCQYRAAPRCLSRRENACPRHFAEDTRVSPNSREYPCIVNTWRGYLAHYLVGHVDL